MINQFQAIEAMAVLCSTFIIPSTPDRELLQESIFKENDFWKFLKKDTLYLVRREKLPFYRPDIVGSCVFNGQRISLCLYELV